MNEILVDGKRITPGKIVCVGRNYVQHIEELGNEIPENMVVFLKPNSTITCQLLSEHLDEKIHYEGEIAFLFEKGTFSAVGFGLDLTKRGLQTRLKEKGLPWERAKAFDGAALFSDFVSLNADYSRISMSLDINGQTMQSAGTDLMMYKPQEILNEIAQFITLEDGDLVMTGTPKGVGTITKGDSFTGSILIDSQEILRKSWIAT